MPNDQHTKQKPSTILPIVIGILAVISFVFGIVFDKVFLCTNGCTIQGVRYCPCPYNLNRLSEAIEQLKATREQLKEVPEQFKEVPEQLGEVLEKLENTQRDSK
jgi:hypothetical protein